MQTTHSINQQHSAHSVRVAVASGRAANDAPVLTSQRGSSLNGRFVENSQAAKNKKRNQCKRTKELIQIMRETYGVSRQMNFTPQVAKKVKYLLKVGVNLGYLVPGYENNSFVDGCVSLWNVLIFYGYQDLIELYLQHHPEAVNQRAGADGRTPLQMAVVDGKGPDIIHLLLRQETLNINQGNDQGWTLLHFAVGLTLIYGFVPELMQLLFVHTDALGRKDLNVNQVDHKGETPLHFACSLGQDEAVEFLLKHPDVDVKCTDKKGQTPLAITVSSCYPSIRIIELLLRHTTADGKPADLGVSDWMAWLKDHPNIGHFELVPVLLETGRLTPEQGWSIATEPFGVDTYRIHLKEYIRSCMAILGNTPEKQQAILERLETLASSPGHDALRVCVAHQFGRPDRACEQISRTLDWRVVLSRRSEEEMVQFLEHIGTYCKAAKDTEASNFFEKLITEVKSCDERGFKRDPLEVWNALKQELPVSFRVDTSCSG